MTRLFSGLLLFLALAAFVAPSPAEAQGYTPTGACPTHQWNYAYGSMTTAADCLQPGFGDISGTLAVSQMPAFGGGDVSFASGGGAGTIAANAVTNSKAAQMAAYTVKGNNTGSTANPSDISVGAWSTYTPTITAGAGTLTTVSASGRYMQIGKLVFVYIDVTITTNGSGAGSVQATLPVTAATTASEHYHIFGHEIAVTGAMLNADCSFGGGTIANIVNSNNSYPGGSGYRLTLTGVYEAQ